MPSLLEALEKKYYAECSFDNCTGSNFNDRGGNHRCYNSYDIAMDDTMPASDSRLISVFIPQMSPLKLVPELLVLNDCDIDCAGDFETIKDKCQRVRELDLAQNKLRDWKEVFHILQHMPRIEFLNLSKNQLMGPISDYYYAPPATISNLRSIVLNGTYLDWHCIDMLLEQLPILEELHLSLNNYKEVLIDTKASENETTTTNTTTSATTTTEEAESLNCNDNSASMENENEEMKMQEKENCNGKSSKKCLKRTRPHTALKTLHFTGNPIENWSEICRLGRVFPCLQNLVLAQCPIKTLQEKEEEERKAEKEEEEKEKKIQMSSSSEEGQMISEDHQKNNVEIETEKQTSTTSYSPQNSSSSSSSSHTDDDNCPNCHFENLRFLNLSCANINTWDDIDRIARFPRLHHVRVKNWPLWDRLESTEHERRQLLIARLPNVSLLNGGGVISADEREDAERAFIRYYMEKPSSERPKRYDELIAKHGQLDPLVNINLKPDKRVKVLLTYNDRTEPRLLDIYRTVADLKVRLEKIVGLPPNKMRLFYLDQDYKDMGPEEMKYPNKFLYSYNICAGDEIIVDEKK